MITLGGADHHLHGELQRFALSPVEQRALGLGEVQGLHRGPSTARRQGRSAAADRTRVENSFFIGLSLSGSRRVGHEFFLYLPHPATFIWSHYTPARNNRNITARIP
jgi:hypothetical protein